jgi:amino acid adenylation domain-containing protein
MSDFMDRISKLSPQKRALLESRLIKQNVPVVADLRRADSQQTFPLSSAQQRLWFLEQFQPGNVAYNYCDAIRFLGTLSVPALEQSLSEIVKRHEILRTNFQTVNEKPIQQVLAPHAIQLPVVSARGIPDLQRNAYIRQATLADVEQPFNLEGDSLLRLKLLRFDDRDHALTFVTHHIVFDGWSYGVFLRELMLHYMAFQGQKRAPLAELTVQYGDFVDWQRKRLESDALDKQLSYWKKQLSGALPALALPLDRPRPPTQTFTGKAVQHALSPELTEALRVLCRKEKATIFMVMLAAFKTLLHRYSGQEDIIVGTPIAGRTQPEFENLIGLFVNMLPLRTAVSGHMTFREVLSRVREVSLNAFANQEVPFDKLVEVLQPKRTTDRSPIFQVNFILQNTPRPNIEIPNLQILQPGVQQGSARFDLTLVLAETSEAISAVMEYNTDLFESATIKRMLGNFEMLLRGIVSNPARAIEALPLLTERERHQTLVEWNSTRKSYPKDKTIHALIEEQAERAPGDVAVVFEDNALTYAQLNREANRLAWRLRENGVGPGMYVGICVERSLEMIVGVLGILKAGAAYVPMDPGYPAERLEYFAADTRMSVVVADSKSVAGLNLGQVKILNVELASQESGIPTSRDLNLPLGAGATDLAYVIYTSGSTGKPKGVQITHRAVVNFLYSMRYAPGMHKTDVLLSVTTLSFDIAGLELFLPLIAGARVVIVSREKALDGTELMKLLEESRATLMQATPSTWRMLLDAGWKGDPDFKALCGGEPLPVKLAEQLLLRGIDLWNMYGPTETTIWSSLKCIDRADQISIGRPIANTQMYVLNAALEPMPIGVAGELYIGGDGVARGYLNRPELVAERFIPNPFTAEPGARMYKTGDVARFLSDGEIQCLGRSDHQVKIRGHRIELGEIETVLGRHPAIGENAVVATDDPSGTKRLVAYLVPKPGQSPKVSDLRGYVEKSLPEYMVPSLFVFLDAFPLTPNGKIDRKALPAPDLVRPENDAAFVAPRNDVERIIAQIMAEVLNLPRVGVHDNFFELGGHSLLIFQVISRVRTTHQVELPVRSLFEAPTVAKLAEMIETIKWAQSNRTTATVATGAREEEEI